MIRNLMRPRSIGALTGALLASALLGSPIANAQFSKLTKVDINNPVEGEIADNGDGSITVTAGGNDTWDASDSFTFLYEEKTGDFDVRVQILNLEVDSASQQDSAKASLHVRADLDKDAADVMINGTPELGANYVETIFRPAKGAGTDDAPVNAWFKKIGAGPYDNTYRPTGEVHLYSPADDQSTWLRMRRVANTIQVYVSANGTNWDMLADYALNPEQFPGKLYVGLSTVAHIDPVKENPDFRVRATYANYGDTPAFAPNVKGVPVAASEGPGDYPNKRVSAANWKVTIPADGKGPNGSFIVVNGNQKNEYILSIDGQGPVSWAAPGYNQGDLDISLSPRDPVAAQKNLGPYSNPDRNTSVTDPASPVTQAWIPSTRQGLVLATIRKNQQQWNDNGEGGPTSPFGAFASVSIDFSSRLGFGMDDGTFQNGEIYVSFYKLGETDPSLPAGASPLALREANIDLATAWFPFAEGWKAGYISDATKGQIGYWAKQGSHSAAVTEGTTAIDKLSSKVIFKWLDNDGNGTLGGLGQLILPGVDSSADGMVFTISNDDDGNNLGQIITALPFSDDRGNGWTVAMRQDDGDPSPTTYSAPEHSEFGFVYIPYTAGNLVGGQVKGTDGSKVHSAGTFTTKRLAAGRYEVTLPGKTGTDGMLLLQNCGSLAADTTLADDAALSYEYSGGNTFIVESHSVESGGGITADKIVNRDTDFYFAWVDFKNPLTPAPLAEIALQSSASVSGPYADEPAAVVDAVNKKITTTASGSARFYRVTSASALKLKSVSVSGTQVTVSYE